MCNNLKLNFSCTMSYRCINAKLYFSSNFKMVYLEIEDTPAKFKSKVWQYFGFEKIVSYGIKSVDKTVTVCKLCKSDISYPTCTTTNMFTHLQRRQTQFYQELDKGKTKVTTASVLSTGPGDVIPKGQLRLQDVIKSQYILKSSRALGCSKSIGIFMTKDHRTI